MSEEDFYVSPWEVRGRVDYQRLIVKFGVRPITDVEIKWIAEVAGEVHPLISRGIFYAHRDFDFLMTWHKSGRRWVLYTGRGPSSHVHIGHLVPWILAKWLSDKFNVELFFQMTDDEKFFDEEGARLEDTNRMAYENFLDVIALGFEPSRLHLVVDTDDIGLLYKIAVRVAKRLTYNVVKHTFGFTDSTNIGLVFYPSLQIAMAFLPSELYGDEVPTLIPAAIDQDPYFRLARDLAETLGYPKPAMIYSKFLPSLKGESKMSSSDPDSAIYTVDSLNVVKRKIMNAFTGGQPTVELQRKLGGNPEICSVFAYHLVFQSDEVVKRIEEDCRGGRLLCGECKLMLFDKVGAFILKHQERREEARGRIHEYKLSAKFGRR